MRNIKIYISALVILALFATVSGIFFHVSYTVPRPQGQCKSSEYSTISCDMSMTQYGYPLVFREGFFVENGGPIRENSQALVIDYFVVVLMPFAAIIGAVVLYTRKRHARVNKL